MHPPLPWKGFLIGFLFGTVGLWLLAMVNLVFPLAETLTQPLYTFGRSLAEILVRDGSAGNAEVAVLMLATGVFYGLIGACAHLAARWMR